MPSSPLRVPVSIVCVFNDPEVRTRCLDRSVAAGLTEAPDTEYLPIDNTAHQFASAGAALNHGIRTARNDVVVLVHQDVFLHSLAALERMAGVLVDDPGIGLAGAVGITASGGVSGVVRDRVVMIGKPAGTGTTVDSLDEVLFMITRDRALRAPLSEDPNLAWHAYAVEFGARMQTQGLRVVAADLPLTHNSMTTNLARLAEAHAHVAALHPSVVPLQTTCGVVRSRRDTGRWRTLLRRRRGAMARLRESVTAIRLARAGGLAVTDVVLADIRFEIDDALAALGAARLTICNLEPDPQRSTGWSVDMLPRLGCVVSASVTDAAGALKALGERTGEEAVLVTGIDARTLVGLVPALRGRPHLVGLQRDTGAWLLVHDDVAAWGDRVPPAVRHLWGCGRGTSRRPSAEGIGRSGKRDVAAGLRRVPGRARAAAWGAAVGLADLTPPRVRYGYVHPMARRLLQRPLTTLRPVDGAAFTASAHAPTGGRTDLRCGLVADHLDVGGIGRVVEMLTEGLRSAGVEPVVVAPADGARAARLRDLGFEVVVADPRSARSVLRDAQLDVVQVHSAPAYLLDAALDTCVPVVPVLHNTEIHYQRPQWQAITALFERADAVIAVSETVRRFHRVRLPAALGDKIVVVPNGAMPIPAATPEVRALARRHLAEVLGSDLDGDVVFACLARYDSQKNIAGTVAGFLAATDRSEVPLRLVAAGDPSDWLEFRRADAIRRAHRHGDRVHLLGNSDAATLLVASDAFVLDSFFEGWPLATTEAVSAGLPVVVSETGGAAELVARAPEGSRLVANPTGPAEAVTDVRARAARRRAPHQANRDALAAALAALASEVAEGGHTEPHPDLSYDAMVAGHARVVRDVRTGGMHRDRR